MTDNDLATGMGAEELDKLVASWADPTRRSPSKHLDLAIAAAFHRRRRKLPPLEDEDPIPGCGCEHCTDLPRDSAARVVPIRSGYHPAPYRTPLDVEAARAVGILEVARLLHLHPVRQGKEWVARCPLHDDKEPSLRLNSVKNLWHCFPCGEGGDGIRLFQRVRGIGFADAVRELAHSHLGVRDAG